MGRAAALPLETDLREAAEERYLSYALSVITSRALPDARDGLKPVQRRILYAMYQNLRLTAGARPRKSAAIVGEVLGKYHPHGDQAAYEAMVRMAQPFSLRYPLVHGEGNFGSLDGDNAAAYRYTEARLTALAEEMLADLAAETVPLRDIYESGQGAIRLRAQYRVESLPRGKRQIVVTSIPYTVNKGELVLYIGQEVLARKLPQVLDVRDESTADVRIVLELKADASPETAMAYLYKHTALQTNFNVNLTCLLPTANPAVGQPARVTLRDLCRQFLDFRQQVVTRRLEHEQRQLEARLHILDALARIYDDLDRAIRIIRKAESRADAARQLMAAFKLDQVQADAILDIRLYQLARLEIEKILAERAERKKRLKEIEALLARPRERWKMIRAELVALGEKYGDKRRTQLATGEELAYDPEAYIVHEDATVILSRDGWLKRVREVKDPSSTRLREGDALAAVLPGTTRDRLVLFSTRGTLYVLPVADVPATTGYGEPVQSLLKFGDGERVVAAQLLREDGGGEAQPALPGLEKTAILVATAKGYGFRTTPDLSETTRAGRRVARVGEGDEIVSIESVTGPTVVVATRRGKMLRFALDEVAELSGPGRGVILMRPSKEDDDRIVGALALPKQAGFLAVTPEGTERRFDVTD